MGILTDIRRTFKHWWDLWNQIPLIHWWNNLPLGYAELHVPAEASVEEVRYIINTEFAHRLPEDRRARAFRIAYLLQDHCSWQKMTRCHTQRPHIKASKCRRCGHQNT